MQFARNLNNKSNNDALLMEVQRKELEELREKARRKKESTGGVERNPKVLAPPNAQSKKLLKLMHPSLM